MAKKDKFAQMQKGGDAMSSFQEMLQTVNTVAAIERQQEGQPAQQPSEQVTLQAESQAPATKTPAAMQQHPRFMRLPNPQIPLAEYNLVSSYCNSFANMTRQDFVELAIIEKLHNDGSMSDDDFNARQSEIHSRLPRGQRKGTKQTSK